MCTHRTESTSVETVVAFKTLLIRLSRPPNGTSLIEGIQLLLSSKSSGTSENNFIISKCYILLMLN